MRRSQESLILIWQIEKLQCYSITLVEQSRAHLAKE